MNSPAENELVGSTRVVILEQNSGVQKGDQKAVAETNLGNMTVPNY